MTQDKPRYVLITPARNEEAYIAATIRSVIAQTVRPERWIIVSDGSTDSTDQIVRTFASEHDWIELVRVNARAKRDFAGKVRAFNAGLERVQKLSYEVVGNLDADITFPNDYIEFLLGRFAANPNLGVAGTPFREKSEQYDYRFASTEHVSGACQLFRRECFEAIGGYPSLPLGGIDLAAVLKARMLGWETKTFLDKTCEHHKQTQAASHAPLRALFKSGYHDYLMGSHALWQCLRCCYRVTKRPYLVGAVALLSGFGWAMARRAPLSVPEDLVMFRRHEQLARLKRIVLRLSNRVSGVHI